MEQKEEIAPSAENKVEENVEVPAENAEKKTRAAGRLANSAVRHCIRIMIRS